MDTEDGEYETTGEEIHLYPSRVRTITPPTHLNLPPIIPDQYYRTSGEAVQKTRQLVKDLHKYTTLLPAESTPELIAYALNLGVALDEATVWLDEIISIRGRFVHLECWWESDHLIALRKNPRGYEKPTTRKKRRRADTNALRASEGPTDATTTPTTGQPVAQPQPVPTGARGVRLVGNKWRAVLVYEGSHLYLGRYTTEQEAITARENAIAALKRGEPWKH